MKTIARTSNTVSPTSSFANKPQINTALTHGYAHLRHNGVADLVAGVAGESRMGLPRFPVSMPAVAVVDSFHRNLNMAFAMGRGDCS